MPRYQTPGVYVEEPLPRIKPIEGGGAAKPESPGQRGRTGRLDPGQIQENIRRYMSCLENSINNGIQWVVFEPNGDPLWSNVRGTIEAFLYNEWNAGELQGVKPEDAFFVRCDRSTMTQNDLDNGRLVCLVGLALLKPAEFVILKVSQWTANRKTL